MAHNTTGMLGPKVLMQMNDYVSSFIKAVTGLLAPSKEGLAVNSGLYAATPKYHNQGDCVVLWVLCKLRVSRLQVRQFRWKHYLFYGLPIFTTGCDKGKNNIMAIIIALHYCYVMRIFLMAHKVRIFLHGYAGNFPCNTSGDIIDGFLHCRRHCLNDWNTVFTDYLLGFLLKLSEPLNFQI